MSVDRHSHLGVRAAAILQANDTGSSTKAAANFYPHQWSWDSAFIAIGLAHISADRAVQEMRSLFRGQWKNGMVPHIVYNADVPADAYFPDASQWDVGRVSSDAPTGVATSGIMQPPMHAIAIRLICDRVELAQAREIAAEFYQPLLDWHRYLMSARDPESSGLVTIVHPWESGMGNSPRWDLAMARIDVPAGEVEALRRRDVTQVPDADEDRHMWIVEVLKRGGFRVDRSYDALPFRVKDIFSSAILVAANEALIRLADLANGDVDDLPIIESWIDRGRRGLAEQWDPERELCCDRDVVDGSSIDVRTIATFSPLLAGQVTLETRAALTRKWASSAFTGHPGLRWPLPTSTSPEDPAFSPTESWRGPVWPVMNWLMWWAWSRIGEDEIADALRTNALDQITAVGFGEYMEPFTGESLGADEQSWTAAAVLDWIAEV